MRAFVVAFLCCIVTLQQVYGHTDPEIEFDFEQHLSHFSEVRNPTVKDGTHWKSARKYIKDWFFQRSLTMKTHTYMTTVSNLNDEDVEVIGENIIGVSEGSKKGNVVIVAADYDTKEMPENPLKINGVSMSALLEIANEYNSRVRTNDFEALYDVIFVAFDLNTKKHYPSKGRQGSEMFVTEWLLPYLDNDVSKLRGAIILDEISNVNLEEGSQTMTVGIKKYFQDTWERVDNGGDKGDFLAMVSHYTENDDELVQHFSGVYNRKRANGPFRLEDMSMAPPEFGDSAFGSMMETFEPMSQHPFWTHNLSAILLTDTETLREDPCLVSSCRPKELIDGVRGDFVKKTSETIVEFLLKYQANHLEVEAENGAVDFSASLILTIFTTAVLAFLFK